MASLYRKTLLVLAGLALLAVPARVLAHDQNEGEHSDYRRLHDDGRHMFHHNEADRYGPAMSDQDRELYRPQPYYQDNKYYTPGYSVPTYSQIDGNVAELDNLLYARDSAQAQYNAAVARGDRLAAKHLYNAVVKLNKQTAALNNRVGLAASATPSYLPSTLGFNPSYDPNNAYSGYSSYGYNPTASPLTAFLPMVQQMLNH